MPLPALPARSEIPVLSKVMRLVLSVMLLFGVKVAVQVTPPSALLTTVKVPLAMIRSALVKPVIASLKVMVTCEVAPIFSTLSASTIVAVGRCVSIA